jgi:hypothetical protein
MYDEIRIAYEVTSAILCFILVRFMIKPYEVTGESRYLGLPLGFGFLGATYAFSAFLYFQPYFFGRQTLYLQLVVRAFAFMFLTMTYYFSRKKAENSRFFWNITLAVLIVGLITALLLLVSIPGDILPSYQLASVCIRVFNLSCIVYICAHTLRSHIEAPDPETIWIPLAYILLGISQYSLLIWIIDNSIFAFFAALAIRWAGLAIFLIVSYRVFYSIKKRRLSETNRA